MRENKFGDKRRMFILKMLDYYSYLVIIFNFINVKFIILKELFFKKWNNYNDLVN